MRGCFANCTVVASVLKHKYVLLKDGAGDDEGSAYVWGAAAAEDAGKGKGGGWGKGAAGGEDEWGAGGKGKDPWGPMAGRC